LIAHRSISSRLTIWFSAVFFAGLVLFGAAMWFNLASTLTANRSHTLERRAERLGKLLMELQAESPERRLSRYQAFAAATGDGLVEVFEVDGARALSSPSSASRAFPWPPVKALAHEKFTEIDFSGQPYRVLARPFLLESESLVLLLAAPLESNRALLDNFFNGLLGTIPALLAVSALGGYALSRKALSPVDAITEATRSISGSNLAERLPVLETGDELQRLSETCNAMLTRLESAVNEIKRFTADASHELRSPLSFIRTVAELALRNKQADNASRKAFADIVDECSEATRLLEDMLTLARAEAGTATISLECVDLTEVVRGVCEKARLAVAERGHTLTVHLDAADAVQIWGDYSRIERVLWILLENAAKYTLHPGNLVVSLLAGKDNVAVTVKDNGIGISATDLPHIFDRFYRADPSRGQVEGAGLGLAIAKWIAGVHGAVLSAESEENVGSVFRIEFPYPRK
jgi:signal transduction histidine kinase